MQETRLGFSSVTSAIVTACSLVMLQTSCPPGTSFPTCFLQFWPSEWQEAARAANGVDWSSSALGSWLMRSCLHVGADILPSEQSCTAAIDCEDLGREVLGSSLSLPNWDHCSLLSCGFATCPTSVVPRGFAEELHLHPHVVFPACFLFFLLQDEKSFRPCCSNPGYIVVTCISKRAVTLFSYLYYGDCQVSGFWV